MIPAEILSAHYKEYASQPDQWVANMEKTKRSIVDHVLNSLRPVKSLMGPLHVAVLGASDRRYLPIHERIFAEVFRDSWVTTIDIDTDHLGGGNKVLQQDVTKPFPKSLRYDVVFSHELMKFLTADEQRACITHSYDALYTGGFAMHVMHEPSIRGTNELRPWQERVDPNALAGWQNNLSLSVNRDRVYLLEFESDSEVDWLRKTTVLVLDKPPV